MSPMRGIPPLLILLLITGIAASFLAFGEHVYPVPASDSHAFVPPALSMEAGKGLRNPIADLTRNVDATGQARYLQYPPLFPLTLSALMGASAPRAAGRALALLGVLNLILTALLFRWAVAPRAGSPWSAALAVSASLLGIATLLLGQQSGRPEVLATFWVLLAAHAVRLLGPARAWPLCGVLLGLLGATHPVGGLFLGLLLAILHAAVERPGAALATLARIAGLGALSTATFLGILALGPYGIAETLAGIYRHGRLVVGESSERLATYWVTHPGATFYALPFLLLAVLALLRARSWRPAGAWPLAAAAGALLAAAVWRLSLSAPEHSYNLQLFAPLVFAGNLRLAAGTEKRFPGVLVVLFHGLAAAGFLRALVLFGFFLTQGVSLDDARRDFARHAGATGGLISVTPSLWVLTEDYDRLRVAPLGLPAERIAGDLFVVQQNYSGRQEPPDIAGFRLVEDRFVRRPCRLFGLPVARTMPGYAFAVYRREQRQPREPLAAARPGG